MDLINVRRFKVLKINLDALIEICHLRHYKRDVNYTTLQDGSFFLRETGEPVSKSKLNHDRTEILMNTYPTHQNVCRSMIRIARDFSRPRRHAAHTPFRKNTNEFRMQMDQRRFPPALRRATYPLALMNYTRRERRGTNPQRLEGHPDDPTFKKTNIRPNPEHLTSDLTRFLSTIISGDGRN